LGRIMSKSGSKSKTAAATPSGPPTQSVANRIATATPKTLPASDPAKHASKPGNTSARNNATRKSRSKTKRDSAIAKELRNHSYSATTTEDAKAKSKNDGRAAAGGSDSVIILANSSGKKTQDQSKISLGSRKSSKRIPGDARHFNGEAGGMKRSASNNAIFTSPSEQRLIREMVKAEMNLMVEKHVKQVLKQKTRTETVENLRSSTNQLVQNMVATVASQKKDQKPEKPRKEAKSTKSPQPIPTYDESDFEQLNQIYTPPRMTDESLFNIERWINPEGSPYTSAKDTPVVTDDESGIEEEYQKKTPTVRFSIPPKQSRKASK